MSAHAIANKFRRALRNGSGATFTLAQLREMAEYGFLVDLSRIEANELLSFTLPSPALADHPLPPLAGRRDEKEKLTLEEGRAFIEALARDR